VKISICGGPKNINGRSKFVWPAKNKKNGRPIFFFFFSEPCMSMTKNIFKDLSLESIVVVDNFFVTAD
jgi:hypothetical protein